MTPGQAAYEMANAEVSLYGPAWHALTGDERAGWERVAQAAIDAAPPTSEPTPVVIDRSKDWWIAKAREEGSTEVGAGMPDVTCPKCDEPLTPKMCGGAGLVNFDSTGRMHHDGRCVDVLRARLAHPAPPTCKCPPHIGHDRPHHFRCPLSKPRTP